MIAPMEKVFIAGPKRLTPEILSALQGAGVVQIDSLPDKVLDKYGLDQEEESRLKGWEAVGTGADHALRLLRLEPDVSTEAFGGDFAEADAAVSPFEQRAAALVERRERLREERELIKLYRKVAGRLADAVQGLDESPRLAALSFLIEKEEDVEPLERELRSAFEDHFLLAGEKVGNVIAAVIIVLRRDAEDARGALGRQGLSELPRTGEYAGMSLKETASRLEERSERAPQELSVVEEDLRRLAIEARGTLKSTWNRARNETLRLRTLRETAAGRYGFALFGWAPISLKGKVLEALDRFEGSVVCAFEPAEAHREAERIPVLLENPDWVKPFEALVSFLNTPRYGSWDPTWTIAALFPLWFGMIVGDIGYGLTFSAAAAYLWTYVRRDRSFRIEFFKMRLSPDAVARLIRIMKPMIVWTLIWGGLYGEFFGDLLQRLGLFGTARYPGLVPVLIPRTETALTANMLILISIGFGIFQVLHGFYLKARLTRRQGEKEHFWEATGYFGGVATLVLFSYAFMMKDYRLRLLIPMFVGSAVFLLGVVRAKMPLMMAELPTQGGHILSYIRIYAVGLASAILANLSTNTGVMLYRHLGIAGLFAGALVGVAAGLLMHGVLLLFLTVSHVLQPIRLIWVEFFTKFDFYSLTGRPYRPFQSIGEDRRQRAEESGQTTEAR